MNTIVDPIKILLLGGYGVGKTALFHRLIHGQPATLHYEPSSAGAEVAIFHLPYSSSSIKLILVDVAAELIMSRSDLLVTLFHDAHAALIVVDCADKHSFQEADQWIDRLHEVIPVGVLKYLLVNKADLHPSHQLLHGGQLDKLVSHMAFLDWAFTVGHPLLGDIDSHRGSTRKQQTIDEIIGRVVQFVLHGRHGQQALAGLPLPLALPLERCFRLSHHDLSKPPEY
eukprot:gene5230-5763_t